ncbi:hypothetical protein VaNZ11_002669 [Volvox africanus]|uniref:SCP domain-containing protein n=1 Tax=Volvox africanus TaxID=51714 RepID=A0ABQ5RSS3_9CHLO|nr:hypothetical protein VaNZ11_002669 [Volvox africanus]
MHLSSCCQPLLKRLCLATPSSYLNASACIVQPRRGDAAMHLQVIITLISLSSTTRNTSLGIRGRRGLCQVFRGYQSAGSSVSTHEVNIALAQLEAQATEDNASQAVKPTAGTGISQDATLGASAADQGAGIAGGADVLSLHNRYRAAHHAAALDWSPSLVSSAQNWANNLANGCAFYHSGMQGVGENLAAGYRDWAGVTDAWYQEVNQYSYANPGFSEATGHATQMLWIDTSEMGCATAQSPAGCWQRTVYVCHYNPPGNVIGEFPQNVD